MADMAIASGCMACASGVRRSVEIYFDTSESAAPASAIGATAAPVTTSAPNMYVTNASMLASRAAR